MSKGLCASTFCIYVFGVCNAQLISETTGGEAILVGVNYKSPATFCIPKDLGYSWSSWTGSAATIRREIGRKYRRWRAGVNAAYALPGTQKRSRSSTVQ